MQLIPKATYLSVIKNSVGVHMFRHNYARVEGVETDLLKDGQISCAFFASFILRAFGLVRELHTRTVGTVKDLELSGWRTTDTPHEGDVVLWEDQQQKSGVYPHIGFYLDTETAISHRDTECTPIVHSLTFDGTRKVTAYYTHDFLA
ncbi:MAG TPA: hypothetical protein VGB97_04370 [Candidatus Paceibacterota bacterium]